MTTPSLWTIPENYPNKLIGNYDYENSPDRFLFSQAQSIDEEITPPIFGFAASRARLLKFDVLPNETMIPLISPRVALLLRAICPDDFQLISAKIHTKDFPIDNYFLLNVTVEISGMDHASSSFAMIPGTRDIMAVEQLQYLDGAMGVHHLAREREFLPFLWTSAELIEKLARERIEACEFEAPEDIHP